MVALRGQFGARDVERLIDTARVLRLPDAESQLKLCIGEDPNKPCHNFVGYDEAKVSAQSMQIAQRGGFAAYAEEHASLYSQILVETTMTRPSVVTKNGRLTPSKAAPAWKASRLRIQSGITRLEANQTTADETYLIAFDCWANETTFVALELCNQRNRMLKFLDDFERFIASNRGGPYSGSSFQHRHGEFRSSLLEILRNVAEVSGANGPRPHDQRLFEATRLAVEFWRKYSPLPLSLAYKTTPGNLTEPNSAFTKWFCELMGAAAGVSVSTCIHTLLATV